MRILRAGVQEYLHCRCSSRVEQLICNQQVGGSIPLIGSSAYQTIVCATQSVVAFQGEVPERSKGADCKSVGSAFGGSNPPLPILEHTVV